MSERVTEREDDVERAARLRNKGTLDRDLPTDSWSKNTRGNDCPNQPWECPLCGDKMTVGDRADHLEGHDV